MASGIYSITNTINGFRYIGQSKNIGKRWAEHLETMNKPNNRLLYKAIEEYGIENFTFSILEICSEDLLDEKEKHYIDLYATYMGFKECKGYNMTLGGKGIESDNRVLALKRNSVLIPFNKEILSIKNSIKIYVYLKNTADYNIDTGERVLDYTHLSTAQMTKDLKTSLSSIYRKINQLEEKGYITFEKKGSIKYMKFTRIESNYIILNTSYGYVKDLLYNGDETLLRVFLFHASFGKAGETYYPSLEYIAKTIGSSPTHLQPIIDCNRELVDKGIISIKNKKTKIDGKIQEKNYYRFLKCEKRG